MAEKIQHKDLEKLNIAAKTGGTITKKFEKESPLSFSIGDTDNTEKRNSAFSPIKTENMETDDCRGPILTSVSENENLQASTFESEDQNHIAATIQNCQKALTSTAVGYLKHSKFSGETYPNGGSTFDDKCKAPTIQLAEQQTSASNVEDVKGKSTEMKKTSVVSISKAENYHYTNIEFLKATRIDLLYPSVTERFYKPQMFGEGGSAQCVLIHSNRLQIVTISPYHPIMVKKKTVISVKYEKSGNVNLLNNKVSGKFKRGGLKMKEKSPLCSVKCSDDSEYTFVSCVRGTLIEVNERLVNQPNLLYEKPWSKGYIAIILPIFSRPKKIK